MRAHFEKKHGNQGSAIDALQHLASVCFYCENHPRYEKPSDLARHVVVHGASDNSFEDGVWRKRYEAKKLHYLKHS